MKVSSSLSKKIYIQKKDLKLINKVYEKDIINLNGLENYGLNEFILLEGDYYYNVISKIHFINEYNIFEFKSIDFLEKFIMILFNNYDILYAKNKKDINLYILENIIEDYQNIIDYKKGCNSINFPLSLHEAMPEIVDIDGIQFGIMKSIDPNMYYVAKANVGEVIYPEEESVIENYIMCRVLRRIKLDESINYIDLSKTEIICDTNKDNTLFLVLVRLHYKKDEKGKDRQL